MELTQKKLKELLHYNPSTGEFTWKVKPSKRVNVGSVAGSKVSLGYIHIGILGKIYSAHRLAWLYMTGDWPKQNIDHKNNIRDDNRFENLREVTASQNQSNRSRNVKKGSSIYKGVSWNKNSSKWVVSIKKSGKKKYLGYFSCEIEAAKAYNKAAKELHGEFAYLNPL